MRLREFDEKERLTKANEKLRHYKTAAGADATAADAAGNFARGHKRFKGINAATKKQFDNDAKLAKLKEVAPPGDRTERMVRHIKAGYARDGKLTPKEKGIAFATAWKAHNAGQVEEQGVAEGLNEFAQGDFNGGDDSNDLQLYLNVAKKLNMKKYKPSTAHNLIAKKMAELVDVVDDDKVDYARHMARKAQGLPNMLEQGVAEDQLDELSKDTLKNYVQAQPARIKGPAGLATTNNRKAARIVDPEKGDIRRALDKYKDPEYGQQPRRLPEDSISAMRRLAGVTTLPPAAATNGPRQYRHMPTAVQPR